MKKKKKKNTHTHNWHNTDFILEVKFHKENFLAKYHWFFSYWSVHIKPLLEWESIYVWLELDTEK